MKEIRDFGLRFGLALNVLGCIIFYRGKEHFIYFTIIGSSVFIAAIICPYLLKPIKRILDLLIVGLGKAVNFITMVIAFYVLFAPIALLLRVSRKDLLDRAINKKLDSYWIPLKNKEKSLESYERMW